MKKIKQIVKGLTIGTMSFIMSFTSLKVNAKSEDLIRKNFNYNFQTKIEEKITEIPTTGTEQSEMLKNAKLNIAYIETFDSQFSGNDGHVHGWLSSFTNYHINHFLTCSLKVKEEQPDNFPKYFQEHLDAVISFNQKEDEVNSLIERLKATKDENKQNILVWKTSFFNQFGYIDEYGGQSAKELLSHYRQLAEKIYNETGYTSIFLIKNFSFIINQLNLPCPNQQFNYDDFSIGSIDEAEKQNDYKRMRQMMIDVVKEIKMKKITERIPSKYRIEAIYPSNVNVKISLKGRNYDINSEYEAQDNETVYFAVKVEYLKSTIKKVTDIDVNIYENGKVLQKNKITLKPDKTDLDIANEKIADLEKQVATLNSQLEQLKKDKTQSEAEKQAKINELNGKITDLSKQIEQLTNDKNSLTEQLNKSQQQVNSLQEKLKLAQQSGTVDKAKIEELTNQVATLNSQLEQLKKDKTQSEAEKQAKINELNGKIEELMTKINTLPSTNQTNKRKLEVTTTANTSDRNNIYFFFIILLGSISSTFITMKYKKG